MSGKIKKKKYDAKNKYADRKGNAVKVMLQKICLEFNEDKKSEKWIVERCSPPPYFLSMVPATFLEKLLI